MCGVHAGPACHLGSGDVQSQAIPFQPGGLEGAANLSMDSSYSRLCREWNPLAAWFVPWSAPSSGVIPES